MLKIKNNVDLKELEKYDYKLMNDVCGNEKNINYEELKNVLKGNNLSLEQLNGVENE